MLKSYVNVDAVREACRSYIDGGDLTNAEKLYGVAHLAVWLRHHAERPQMVN